MKYLLLTACALSALGARAQTSAPTDTLAASAATSQAPTASPAPTARKWYRPKHLVLQTGGGLGMVAAGAGYEFSRDRLETDVLFGYVPEKYGGSTLTLVSAKFMFSPFRLRVAEKFQVLPLTVGAFFSYTHGTINDEVRGQYSRDYYWFSTDTRVGPMLGGRVTYLAAPIAATGKRRKLSAYYELGTNDLYLASYFVNLSGLNPGQILTLALGIKADF